MSFSEFIKACDNNENIDISHAICANDKNILAQYVKHPYKNLEKITIKDLLTMSSGIHDNTYVELFNTNNWISAFLAQDFPHEPGTHYRYSTHGSHMLSAIITKATSLSLEDFLNKYLFHPIGIYEAHRERSPEKLTAGGMELSLYPYSLVKIPQLLLNRGV